MRWFGNMGELRNPEGEKSSCGVAHRLTGVCVVEVKAPFELKGVDTPCCFRSELRKYDPDCPHGDLSS